MGSMDRNLRLLAASLALWGIGEGLFFYLQPIYLAQLGADPLQVGLILGMAGAAMALTHIPAGLLADRFGRKTMMALAWAFGAAASVLMLLATSLWLFVAALLLYYLTSFVMSPLSSYVTAARGSWSTGRALTTISASFNAGAVAGPFLGGVMAAHFGIRPLFAVAAVLFVVSTILILLVHAQPIEPHPEGGRFRSLASNRLVRRILAVTFVVIFATTLFWPLTPLFLNEVRGLSVAEVGALGSFFALGIVVFNLGLGRLEARRGSLVGQGVVALSAVLLWRGLSLPIYAAGYLLAGASRTTRSLLSAQVERVVGRDHLGLAFGVSETVASSALIVGPLLAGAIYHRSPAVLYPLSVLLIAGSIALSAVVLPKEEIPLTDRTGNQGMEASP
jgi:DHA1 family multidrug resistance protein-like MFS transporter